MVTSLYGAALLTCLSYVLFRRYFLEPIPFNDPMTYGRLSATLSSVLILYFTFVDTPHGVASFLTYMIVDTLYNFFAGSSLDSLIVVHHLVCIFIAVAYFPTYFAGISPQVVEQVTRTLLFMEGSNPFLHLSLTINREDRFKEWRGFVLPITGPLLLVSYLWLRVIQCSLCVPIVWQHRADFHPLGELYTACIGGLAALQIGWFFKLASGTLKVLSKN